MKSIRLIVAALCALCLLLVAPGGAWADYGINTIQPNNYPYNAIMGINGGWAVPTSQVIVPGDTLTFLLPAENDTLPGRDLTGMRLSISLMEQAPGTWQFTSRIFEAVAPEGDQAGLATGALTLLAGTPGPLAFELTGADVFDQVFTPAEYFTGPISEMLTPQGVGFTDIRQDRAVLILVSMRAVAVPEPGSLVLVILLALSWVAVFAVRRLGMRR